MERRSRLTPDEMRNSLGKAAAETRMITRMRPSETVLLPVPLREFEPHSELETVQYCSFCLQPFVPRLHEKISSADFRL